jgi:hypothetical protein
MLAFRRRDEHRVDIGMGNHFVVVGGMKVRAGKLGEFLGVGRVLVGDGYEAHRRMLRGEPRPQRADAAGTDHGDAELFCRHAPSSRLWFPQAPDTAVQSSSLKSHGRDIPLPSVPLLPQATWRRPA